jgi:hypothetical protein
VNYGPLVTLLLKAYLLLAWFSWTALICPPLCGLAWVASMVFEWQFRVFKTSTPAEVNFTFRVVRLTPIIVVSVALALAAIVERAIDNEHGSSAFQWLSMGVYFLAGPLFRGGKKLGAKLIGSSALTSINAASFRREVQQSV